MRRLKSFGMRRQVNGSYQTLKPPGSCHLAEHALPILVPEGDQHAVIVVVRKVIARALRLLAGQVGQLVVAVEMNLVCPCHRSSLPSSRSSLIVVSPAAASSVGNQSRPENISFETSPALMCPGQRIMAGTRKAPSQFVSFSLRKGVVAASGHENWLGPLSVRVDHDRVVGDAKIIERLEQLSNIAVVLDHSVGIFVPRHAALPDHRWPHVGEDVHPGGVHPDEERLAGLRLAADDSRSPLPWSRRRSSPFACCRADRCPR